jgi:hypothetical protein
VTVGCEPPHDAGRALVVEPQPLAPLERRVAVRRADNDDLASSGHRAFLSS